MAHHIVAHMHAPVHDEDGSLTEAVEFDYAQVSRDLGEEQITEHDIAAASKAFSQLIRWVWQNGPREEEILGIKIRLIIVAWIFLEELRSDSMSDTARAYKLDKQSLGRWVEDWKREFPFIKTPHMRE